ncbi:unnamed protein product [Penicillium salamii]|uniref:Uncharacterized protein n=1 Tax=Penicillium salamii TaxID=1612424 RepID=A0A9W4JQ85_9EURO|nr:unnamed protein product [Penicillium salamii]CAG8249586.1 unnamed protein product [Penicillium salamii]CAG8388682.1 unnamed protein product [Penicillium salamii]CAG8402162.1 unnamed protein product [Penicillium salamii]CAG8406123.1 unnamed protein product [Penicillium salamii]
MVRARKNTSTVIGRGHFIFLKGFNMASPDTLSYESDTASEEQSPSQLKTKIQAKFRIARPPPKSSQRLRLSPKLLLQIQQLPRGHRPVPVLEIWQPPLRKSGLTKGFSQRPKLGMKDIYATVNEPYITRNERPQEQESQHPNPNHDTQEKDVIAAMYQLPARETTASSSAIHFRDAQCVWQAMASPAGSGQNPACYKFAVKNEENTMGAGQSKMFMQWEKRALSTDTDGSSETENEHFVLLAIDRQARRKSRIATMSREGFEITVRKSSILEHLRTCMSLTSPVSNGTTDVDSDADLEVWLYTHVLTLGVWVASQEGWLN